MIGAADNPFRRERCAALRFRGPAMPDLLARLMALGGRGLLVGPQGSGKTTLLERLAYHCTDTELPVTWLRAESDRAVTQDLVDGLLAMPLRGILLIDELERVPWLLWRRVVRHVGTDVLLVASSHRRFRLPVLHRHATRPELLRDLVTDLAGPGDQGDLAGLWRRQHGNLRDCLAELYRRAAGI